MPHRYLQQLTTASVAGAQQRYGSRAAIDRMVTGADTDALLGPGEAEFIAARDGSTSGSRGTRGRRVQPAAGRTT
jgi:hypothetical protein